MNLLLLSHRVPYPPNKGEKIRTFHHLEYLINKGHRVTVVTPLENSEEQGFAEALSDLFTIEVLHTTLDNRYQRMLRGMLQGLPLSVTNFYSATLQNKINQQIITNRPDAIMCTSSAMARYVFNTATAELIDKYNIRLIMDFMDLDSLKWTQYSTRKPWPLSLVYKREAKLLSQLENETLHRFDASLFVSAEEKNLLQNDSQLKDKVHVVTNGVDQKTYRPASGSTPPDAKLFDGSPVLLFTGVMDYYPNEDAVIWFAEEIWPSIIKQYASAQFVIAGMRPSRKVKDLGKINGIQVTGYLDDILPYYQQADFLVTPFRVARGIQNKVLQAMACGLPVLTSPEGAAGIKCIDDEHLKIAKTSSDYLSAINLLLEDKVRYNKMSQAGLNLVAKHYSWSSENVKLEQLLSGQTVKRRAATPKTNTMAKLSPVNS